MSFGSRLADHGRDLATVQKILMDFVIASNPGKSVAGITLSER
jgi:hypothetical protein